MLENLISRCGISLFLFNAHEQSSMIETRAQKSILTVACAQKNSIIVAYAQKDLRWLRMRRIYNSCLCAGFMIVAYAQKGLRWLRMRRRVYGSCVCAEGFYEKLRRRSSVS